MERSIRHPNTRPFELPSTSSSLTSKQTPEQIASTKRKHNKFLQHFIPIIRIKNSKLTRNKRKNNIWIYPEKCSRSLSHQKRLYSRKNCRPDHFAAKLYQMPSYHEKHWLTFGLWNLICTHTTSLLRLAQELNLLRVEVEKY